MTPATTGEPAFDYALLKTIALVVFFLFFAVIVLRLVLAGRHEYDRASRIPLEDQPVDDRQASKTE